MASQGIIKQLYICLTPKVCLTRLISTPKTVSNTATPKRWCSSNASNTTSQQRQKVVILGTGWGSYSVLKNVNKKLFDVIVVSPRNHFLFTPLLASTTVGTLEFRYVCVCIQLGDGGCLTLLLLVLATISCSLHCWLVLS